jgi:uncharacterized membrane protein
LQILSSKRVPQIVVAESGSKIAMSAIFPAAALSTGSGATLTNNYGVYIAAQAATGVTNAYGIVQAGASDFDSFAGATTFSNTLNVTRAATFTGAFLNSSSTGLGRCKMWVVPAPLTTVCCSTMVGNI